MGARCGLACKTTTITSNAIPNKNLQITNQSYKDTTSNLIELDKTEITVVPV